MKRRYKAGDWIRVPLGGSHDAVAILAYARGSRLFGYFFAVPAGHVPGYGELRALTRSGALAAVLFGGAPIEQARWQVLVSSLALNRHEWPLPEFASRGAFGESWMLVRYDPDTLQIVERTPLEGAAASHLADARFLDAREVETLLRGRLAGRSALRAQSVYEIRSPVDDARLSALERGGRVQFSSLLSAHDLDRLAAFLERHPGVDLRIHGFRHGFDAEALARFSSLTSLTLDVHVLQHPGALRMLTNLRELRIGPLQTDLGFLEAMTSLRRLELRGTRADPGPVRLLTALEVLALENVPALGLGHLAGAPLVRELELAHGRFDLAGLAAFAGLRSLMLRALDIESLTGLERLPSLQRLSLIELGHLRELQVLADVPQLRELHVRGMPQLNVSDFSPLAACAALRELEVDLGSRRKEREIYRALARRVKVRLEGRSAPRGPGT